jgi:hypothetical protein
MKLIIFVHTCKEYENSRAKLIEHTWGNRDNVIFITDNPESELKNNIYIGKYKKGFTYHHENVIKMFNLFLTNYGDYDFFMMIDDDSYLYIDKLESYLSFFDKDDNYMIGDYLNWVSKRTDNDFVCDYLKWAGGGSGLVFTKLCILTFLNLIRILRIHEQNHDVWLHNLFVCSDKKIKRVHCPGFHQTDAQNLLKKYNKTDKTIISVHLERNMNLIYEYHI